VHLIKKPVELGNLAHQFSFILCDADFSKPIDKLVNRRVFKPSGRLVDQPSSI